MGIIKSNLTKNSYPFSLIDKVKKKCLDHKFSTNCNKSKDIPDFYYLKLPHISKIWDHVKWNFRNFEKQLRKEKFNIKLHFTPFKIKNYLIWNLFWYINLLMLVITPTTLVQHVVILKAGLRNISEFRIRASLKTDVIFSLCK